MDSGYGGNGTGDDHEDLSKPGKGKIQYHRHTAEQIQHLEMFFKDCQHPDENQRQQLSRDLGLDTRQIKFWFQNKRTQAKAQNERADNNSLRVENERLHCENLAMREALRNLECLKCEGIAFGEDHGGRQQNMQRLRNENDWLKKEHERLLNIFTSFSRRSSSSAVESLMLSPAALKPSSNLYHEPKLFGQGIGSGSSSSTAAAFSLEHMAGAGSSNTSMNNISSPYKLRGIQEMEKCVMVETAINAMDELVELLRVNEPLWIRSSTDHHGRCIIHHESYNKIYPKISHVNSPEAWIESSKESGTVSMTAMQLIDIFQDPKKLMDFFPTIVNKARTVEVLDTGNRGGSLFLMYEKLHVLSPLVPPREFTFLRYIRQLDSTTWVVVHVSYDCFKEVEDASSSRSWMFPSGCLIQEMPNGKSKMIWIEHVQVDDKSLTHPIYKDIVCDSQAYGAKRWLVTLERMCERLAFSMGSRTTTAHELESIIDAPQGRRNMTKLSHKMVKNFHAILSMQDKSNFPQLSELNKNDFRVSIRKSDASASGQTNAMIVCVATSLSLPISFENLFHFFKDDKARPLWDVLSNGNPIHEIAHISTGSHPGNSISLMQPFLTKENNMLILQESCIDTSGAILIYAPIELSAITSIINGHEDSTEIPVLPSGFVISSDGDGGGAVGASSTSSSMNISTAGSLLTVALQILVSSDTFSEQPNMESVETVHALINSTIQKIKMAIGSDIE